MGGSRAASSAFQLFDFSALCAEELTWEIAPGPYATDPRLPKLLDVASAAREKAFERLRIEWGLYPGPIPIRWRWDTAAPPQGPTRANVDASPALPDFELGRTYLESGVVHVVLPARKFLARPDAAVAVVRHECVHAVHASHAGTPARYEATPRWLREGLALHFSGEGEERVRERIAYTIYGGAGSSSFLKGLDARDVPRAEAYLAVAWLRTLLGEERFARLAGEIIKGESALRTVEALAGIDPLGLRDGAGRAARRAVRKLLPPPREARFRSLLARLPTDPTGVQRELETLLGEDESGPLAGTVRYLLAREAMRSPADVRALAAARAHLEALREAPGALWRPEALVLLGQCYLKEGRRALARRSWLEVVEMFGEDRVVAESARRLLAASEGNATER